MWCFPMLVSRLSAMSTGGSVTARWLVRIGRVREIIQAIYAKPKVHEVIKRNAMSN